MEEEESACSYVSDGNQSEDGKHPSSGARRDEDVPVIVLGRCGDDDGKRIAAGAGKGDDKDVEKEEDKEKKKTDTDDKEKDRETDQDKVSDKEKDKEKDDEKVKEKDKKEKEGKEKGKEKEDSKEKNKGKEEDKKKEKEKEKEKKEKAKEPPEAHVLGKSAETAGKGRSVVFKVPEEHKPVWSDINIENPTNEKKTFKVKCTSNEHFRVQPPLGFIKPNDTARIRVWFQNQKGIPTEKRKHYFAVYYMKAQEGKSVKDMWHKQAKQEGICRVFVSFEKATDDKSSKSADAGK